MCRATKPLNHKIPGLLTAAPLAFKLLQILAIDYLTSLSCTKETYNQHIFVAVDSFTRFFFAFQLPKINTKNISRALTSIFVILGPPRTIFSNKGP